MLKTQLAVLLLLVPFSANAAGFKAPVTSADRAAYAKMNGTQAYNYLASLTGRACPGVHVRASMSRETAISMLSTTFATFDRAVKGVEDACNDAVKSSRTKQANR